MWALVNRTRFAAERTFARDRNGAEVFIVVVKGTFTIREDGSTTPAAQQEPIVRAPVYTDRPGASSLLYEADLILGKPATDVLFHGYAYAARGRNATAVEASLRVGPILKRVVAVGDRIWERRFSGLAMSEPEPFERMPIVYERAFGGAPGPEAGEAVSAAGARNPVGVGLARTPAELIGQKAPNMEDPNDLIHAWDHRPNPAGFGPIARSFSPRLERAGTYDAQWEQHRMPLPPLDFSERFYQCAPDDQQVAGYLRGGEAVELRCLTPGGSMRFALPRIKLGFTTRIGGTNRSHEADLHTVLIEPERERVILVWHTALPCHHELYTLRRTTVAEEEVP